MGGVANWGGGEGMITKNPLEEMGRWLKEQGIIQRERTDAEPSLWPSSSTLIEHQAGSSGSKAAGGGGQPRSHLELGPQIQSAVGPKSPLAPSALADTDRG